MYEYSKQKVIIFTDDGQKDFLRIRDKVQSLLKSSGAFMMINVFESGDSWDQLACVDRLVELGEIVEVPRSGISSQHRVFVSVTA